MSVLLLLEIGSINGYNYQLDDPSFVNKIIQNSLKPKILCRLHFEQKIVYLNILKSSNNVI